MIYEIVNEDINETVTENIMATRPVYPGTALRVGSSGSDVALMQSYLNAIKNGMFPSLSRLSVDGKYGQRTKNTVVQYQGLSGLSQDGIIGKNTWDAIVSDYENLAPVNPDIYPGVPLRPGDSGAAVMNMQTRLNNVSPVYTAINYQSADGKYGNNMTNAVRRFQGQFGLAADGIIGPQTWNKIVAVSKGVRDKNNTAVTSSYPGYVLNSGSQGDSVRFIQSYLNAVNS
ncbi:MAG: peptidoglycan-binding protein, partial [Oscillospiraceae bacterium]|nr:peptidoglycan-binding protein [Oscillospiraceae bacterium]